MLTITETITGDTASGVSIITLARSDDGATPSGVTLPLAMTTAGGGAWSASFTDSPESASYSYQYVITWQGDGTTSGPYAGTLQTNAIPASGYYTNQGNLETKWGAINIQAWSNKDNANLATNIAAVQLGLTWTDDKINSTMANGPYVVPLSPVTPDLQDIANDLAAYWLYENRGLNDKTDKLGSQLKQAFSEAMQRLVSYKGGIYSLACQRRWPAPTAPIAFG